MLVVALITKANALAEVGRPTESTALLTHAMKLAVEHDLGAVAGRAYYNLADNVMAAGRFAEAEEMLTHALELARRRGDRPVERRPCSRKALIALARSAAGTRCSSDADELLEQADDIWAAQTGRGRAGGARGAGRCRAASRRCDAANWRCQLEWPSVGRRAQGRAGGDRARDQRGRRRARGRLRAAVRERLLSGTSETPSLFAETIDCAFAAGEYRHVEQLLSRGR